MSLYKNSKCNTKHNVPERCEVLVVVELDEVAVIDFCCPNEDAIVRLIVRFMEMGSVWLAMLGDVVVFMFWSTIDQRHYLSNSPSMVGRSFKYKLLANLPPFPPFVSRIICPPVISVWAVHSVVFFQVFQ
jgi:hypothetical protein